MSTHSLTEFKDVALRHAADLTRATDAIHFRICTAADDRNGDPLWSFDILDKGAMTLDALCAEIGASPRGLRTVLNALVGLDVLSKDAAGRYALTEESATFLVTGKSAYHGAFFLLTKEPMLSSWGQLHEVVRSGRPTHHINREQEGIRFFLRFVEDIFPIHYPGAQALARALAVPLAPVPISVLDLAAGSGVWSIALARLSPQICVTAVDWPGIIPITKKVTTRCGLVDRYTFVAGDLDSADFGQGQMIATLGKWATSGHKSLVYFLRCLHDPGAVPPSAHTQLAGDAWAAYSQVSRWKIHLVYTTEDLQPAFLADAAVT